MQKFLSIGSFFAVALMAASAWAEVKMPAIFGDNMVLQREMPVPVWGWAGAGEKVTVELLANGHAVQTQQTVADGNGNWKVALKPIKNGPAYGLRIRGSN